MNHPLRLVFIGFRHGHIMGMYHAACAHPKVAVVAAVEDDAATIDKLRCSPMPQVELTHTNWREVIDGVTCDAVAVGDYFARRGEIIIAALSAGKHVISDKPICTRLDELERIEQLARDKSLVVSALLDLRDSGAFITARRLIRAGAIGEVHTVLATAQHPLLLESRPKWYFEPGKHGGTLNDIAVHATDLIPWLTGRTLASIVATRAWNARLPQFPHFQDAAQFMLRLDNNGSVFGDVSYLAPDGIAYTAPHYWRVTCHGTGGMIEAKYGARQVEIATRDDKSVRIVPADADRTDGRLAAFLQEIEGKEKVARSAEPTSAYANIASADSADARDGELTTPDVLRASKTALLLQQKADRAAEPICVL